MPRDGTQTYILPFPDVVADTTIESPVYNGFTNDVAQDLNNPRPITSGGTGATSAAGALAALGGEAAGQLVTNYDSHLFRAGSFYSAAGATGAPTANAASGIVYIADSNNGVVEARDSSDGKLYIRRKVAGVWGAWVLDAGDAATALKVAKAGDTMTGPLVLPAAAPTLPEHATNKAYVDAADLVLTTSANNRVRYDAAQGLTAAQQLQGRTNIGLSQIAPQCGYLQFSNATSIVFVPKNGNRIRIDGVDYVIPAAGITGLMTGVFINGVGGSNLAANTNYFVYVFNNAGTLAIDYRGTGHGVSNGSGNEGVEVLSSSDTRTFVGMCYTNASIQVQDSTVASWFNRKLKSVNSSFNITAAGTYGSLIFTNLGGSSVLIGCTGYISSTIAASTVQAQLRVDAIGVTNLVQVIQPANNACNYSTSISGTFVEGAHVVDQTVAVTGTVGTTPMQNWVQFYG